MSDPAKFTAALQRLEQWLPVDAPLTNEPLHRSAEALRAVAAQFNVTSSPRYRRTKDQTFCKTFVWDVTRALGCELPHWVDASTREPCAPFKGDEVTANGLLTWLELRGQAHGWRSVQTEIAAAAHAAVGGPAIALWQNTKGHGHVALLLPSTDATTRIAQAGSINFFDRPLKDFGVPAKFLRFFIHA